MPEDIKYAVDLHKHKKQAIETGPIMVSNRANHPNLQNMAILTRS